MIWLRDKWKHEQTKEMEQKIMSLNIWGIHNCFANKMLKYTHKEAEENIFKYLSYIFKKKNKEQDLLIISVENNSIIQ